jgi:mRNA-degrading endonuclease RelE of RelBE toxin-antitoxin system
MLGKARRIGRRLQCSSTGSDKASAIPVSHGAELSINGGFFALLKAMLDLGENPRPRGYDKVEGAGGIYRVWVARDGRLLYSIDQGRSEPVIEAVRKKDEATYRQS